MASPLRPVPAAALLLALSLLLAGGLVWARLPAAFLLGPMVAAVALAASGITALRVPTPLFVGAQAVIGCMIAVILRFDLAVEIGRRWPVFAVAVLSVLTAATLIGAMLARWQVLPGTVAIWGTSPGAATAMVLMAERFGADIRLVAFMQYLRVVIVATVASVVARIVSAGGGTHATAGHFGTPLDAIVPGELAGTLALIGFGVLLGLRTRVPAGALLGPMAAGAVLADTGLLRIALPTVVLLVSYAVLGWAIGLRFTGPVLRHAWRALPRVAASILVLVAACGLLALGLAPVAHVSLMTAYLATSPGGADSVAIIAAATPVDVPFVMATQVARFLLVLLAGPAFARLSARALGAKRGAGPASAAGLN